MFAFAIAFPLFCAPRLKFTIALWARMLKRFTLILGIMFLFSMSGCGIFHFQPPKCKVPGCHVKLIHPHGGKQFRGRPWWMPNQNPKIGQEYERGKRLT
jgi:hypothetical protein